MGFFWFGWRRKEREQELERELRAHLEAEAEERREDGLSAEEASYSAKRAFGNQSVTKEDVRAAWGWTFLETIGQDLRYAFRSLRGSPVFALVAITSLGLGIGANTAIFSFVNAILLKQLPVRDPERLVRVAAFENGKETGTNFSLPFVEGLDNRRELFDGVLGRFPVRVNLMTDSSAQPLNGEVVTGSYFRTLRVKPAAGRLLTEADVDAAAANPVCVISYSLWQARFAGDARIVGRQLVLNAHPYTVIGVTEEGFDGPQLQTKMDVQIPVSRMGDFMNGMFTIMPDAWKSPNFTWLYPLARLRSGVSRQRAEVMVDSTARAGSQTADKGKKIFRLLNGSQGTNYNSAYSKPVTILMEVVGLVLLIACANLANLLLARANARAKEFALRLSLGASRWRLIRQLMVESCFIAVSGGLVGLALAFWMVRTLLLYLNAGRSVDESLQVTLDPKIVGFSALLSLFTAVIFGLLPAWQSAHVDTIPELRGSSSLSRTSFSSVGLRRLLIVSQIALSLTICFAAGLLTQTLSRLRTIHLGFDPSRVINLAVDPAMSGFSREQSGEIVAEILDRLRGQPSVSEASVALVSPLSGSNFSTQIDVPGYKAKTPDEYTYFNPISPGYLKTLSQTLLAGRDFDERDVKKSQAVAIVNQLFAAQYMPALNPIGRHFKTADNTDVEVVGIVKNSLYQSLREKPGPLFYVPYKQTEMSGYTVLVKTKLDARSAIANIEQTIRSVNPKLPVYDVGELQDQVDRGVSTERALSFLSALFSGLTTLLCSVGIYGLIAYGVSRRTNEIGVRVAIGAQKSDVAKLFGRESAWLIVGGIAIGIPVALAAARVLTSQLYGIEPTDLFTLGLTTSIFAAAGILASVFPVWKATRIEPLQALRYE